MRDLFTGTEMKEWERQTMERYKLPSVLLMERAAMAVTEELCGGGYDLRKVLVACGTGNNGGDGLAIARLLHGRGIHTEVCVVGSLTKLSQDARAQLEMYQAMAGDFVTAPKYAEYTVIVDAIFGIGCHRKIEGIAAEVIEKINEAPAPVVAVDIPSGVDSDTGKICGCAVNASKTITFFTQKLGMLFYPAKEYCGEVAVAGLGVPMTETKESSAVIYTQEDQQRLPLRRGNSHKGSYGKVLVMAGSPKIFGAAYFAAAAAYKMGAGLVKAYTPQENITALETLLPEALMEGYDRNCPQIRQLKQCMEWADVIVIGPGFGTDRMAEKILRYVICRSKVPLVVDADGIHLLAKNRKLLEETKVPVVLTPHVQEMAKFLKKTTEEILEDPIGIARQASKEYKITVVLKDAVSVVADGEEKVYVNTSGNSGMATGGSGDVLSGMIGSLMGQGMNALEAARLGVYLHGKAGDAAAALKSVYSMTAVDLLNSVAEVTRI